MSDNLTYWFIYTVSGLKSDLVKQHLKCSCGIISEDGGWKLLLHSKLNDLNRKSEEYYLQIQDSMINKKNSNTYIHQEFHHLLS